MHCMPRHIRTGSTSGSTESAPVEAGLLQRFASVTHPDIQNTRPRSRLWKVVLERRLTSRSSGWRAVRRARG